MIRLLCILICYYRTMSKRKKVICLIIDGWGLSPAGEFNAIDNAKTPNYDKLVREYPNTRLKSDGLAVGLPEGQPGTSEVNHTIIGAGRVILQELPKINDHIATGTFFTNQILKDSIAKAEDNGGALHLIGLLSDGGVHSLDKHLFALFKLIDGSKFSNDVYLHLFTDGRDAPPKSAEKYLQRLDQEIQKFKNLKISIATIQGRYFLDRDRDWDKSKTAVELIINGNGKEASDWRAIINFEYNQNITDEFFPQYVLNNQAKLQENDSVIFFNYRTDRLYQLVSQMLTSAPKSVNFTTFVKVSDEFKTVNVAFPKERIESTLAETVSKAGKKQLHITETEKYAHLTFFLNGEREKELSGEEWVMVESNRYVKPFYNYEPSMRNFDITKRIIQAIDADEFDFIIANLPSPDMVGHTGNYHAAVISAESIDYCLGRIYNAIKGRLDDYALIITADHGNSDMMWDFENNQPHTQHTTAPVPFILVSNLNVKLDPRETLADVAPTILDLMGIKKPAIMSGESLLIQELSDS